MPARNRATGHRTRHYATPTVHRSAAALGAVEAGIVKPYLVGSGGLLDDGDVERAYGSTALILVRPDGYIGLVADPADTGGVDEYLRSL
jgi:hypothetical protein